MLIATRHAGIFVDSDSGAYVTTPAPAIETRSDALEHEVPRTAVDADLLAQTERVVRLASRSLSLDPVPRVRWLPSNAKGCRGCVFDRWPDELWIKIQDLGATKNSALHELRHAFGLRDQKYLSLGLLTMEERKRDANHFAATWSLADVPPVPAPAPRLAVDQAAARAEWERRWLPVHEAVSNFYAQRAEARRGGPMLRASTSHPPGPPQRKQRRVNGRLEIQCEQCGEWVGPGVTHHCPAARGLVPMRRTAQGAEGKFGHLSYSVKAL